MQVQASNLLQESQVDVVAVALLILMTFLLLKNLLDEALFKKRKAHSMTNTLTF
jgi:hypothetical protein